MSANIPTNYEAGKVVLVKNKGGHLIPKKIVDHHFTSTGCHNDDDLWLHLDDGNVVKADYDFMMMKGESKN